MITDMYKNRSSADTSPEQQRTEPVKREYVTAVQQRARELAGQSTLAEDKGTLAGHIHREQQHIEQEMSQLRARAVQARRLAEHIEGLSGSPSPPEWTKSSANIKDVHSARTKAGTRRKDGVSAGSPGPRSFNPLHPSMELPPEQLIRLLKLHTRKTRKHKKQIKSQQADPVTPDSPDTVTVVTTQTTRTRTRPEQTVSPPAFAEPGRRGLLLPSTIAGILLGSAVSAWLFLEPHDGRQPTVSTTVTEQLQQPSTPARKTAPAAAPAPVANLAIAAPPAPPLAATSVADEKSTSVSRQTPDSEWRAAVLKEQKRLYREARQRFNTQLESPETNQKKTLSKTDVGRGAEAVTTLAETPATDPVPTEEAFLEQVVVHYSVTGSAASAEEIPAPDSPLSASTESASAAESPGPEPAW